MSLPAVREKRSDTFTIGPAIGAEVAAAATTGSIVAVSSSTVFKTIADGASASGKTIAAGTVAAANVTGSKIAGAGQVGASVIGKGVNGIVYIGGYVIGSAAWAIGGVLGGVAYAARSVAETAVAGAKAGVGIKEDGVDAYPGVIQSGAYSEFQNVAQPSTN
jgi:hypothetical protein